MPEVDIRVGHGVDVHAFTEAKEGVWLGGICVPFAQGLAGHSDADVVIHAVVDALLGAIGEGDIGQHFPPSDMQWKDASSLIFLRHVVGLVAQKGGVILCVDVTLMGEAPRLGPVRGEIRHSLAVGLGIEEQRVNVKATTTERLGFLGRKEGLGAFATATVRFS